MSPLVTAQERKRRILERRRKEREQQTSQENNTLSNAAAAFASNNMTSNSAFGSLHTKRRRSDTATSNSRATRLFSSSDDSVTPKAAGTRSSLFGAVMQRTSSSSTNDASSTPTKQRNNNAMSASTPLQKSHLPWNDVTTPSSSSRSKSFLSAKSPGGFALLKVLESMASPFRHKEDQDANEDEEEHSPVADARIEEWQEGFLRENTIGVVDWSLKRKLRLECHPGSCLPNPSDGQNATSSWQHPAMYPLPTFDENETDASQEVSATMLHPSLQLSELVRGRNALLHRLVRQDARLWKQRRNRQWQEAFRSLFMKWMKQVEALQNDWDEQGGVSPQTAMQTYFYAMAPGQTILFRIGMEDKTDHKSRIVPMIISSSTTHQMRSKLRSMGAKLFYHHDKSVEFEESVMERRKAEKKVAENETEEVHQELEALRRAQAHGETAGADVSIATKTKSAATMKSPRSIPPLCLVGEDDCFAFFEFYLNTMGRDSTWVKGSGDVPLLLSRKIGPFMHASMQSLTVTSRRETNESTSQQDHHAAIELRGPILPCAMAELISTAASRMMQDTTTTGKSHSSGDHEDDVGSHYFVIQAQAHDGEERTSVDSATTGTASSRWLNDGSGLFDVLAANKDGPNECEHGEVVSMMVWDIARPAMIAYKTEPKLIG